MDIIEQVFGGAGGIAVFGINSPATSNEVAAARREAEQYGEAVNRLVDRIGLHEGKYADRQPLFGPLLRMMALAGWTFSGSGFFSAAFYKGGLAIKVSLRGSGDAAFDYLEWCQQQPGLPGLPTVYGLFKFSHVAVAVMERYECARDDIAEGECFAARDYEAIAAIFRGDEPEYYSGLAETAEAIVEKFAETSRLDMHKGNVMLTRDGDLVITDPLGRSRDRDTNYGGKAYSYTYATATDYRQAA